MTADDDRVAAIEIDLRTGWVVVSGPLDPTSAMLIEHLVGLAVDQVQAPALHLELRAVPAVEQSSLAPLLRLRDECASHGKPLHVDHAPSTVADLFEA